MVRARDAAKPSLLRAINLRATFELVHARGPLAAQHVVRDTGLSKPTVADVLSQLLELRLLHRVGRSAGARGPSAQLYDVNPRAGWVLSLDVGREWVRAALVDLTGGVVERTLARTPRGSAEAVIAQLREAADHLTGTAGIALAQVDQIVVGTPGVMRSGDDHFSLAPNLPGWEQPEVVSGIREALVAPLLFENDVNLAAVGEQVWGVAEGSDDFVLLSIGTGVGMGVVVDGGLRRGAAGHAGEIGYLRLDLGERGPRVNPSEGAGAFEELVSSAAILAMAESAGMGQVGSVEAVFDAARAGDDRAQRVVETEAARLAYAIAAIAAVLDPELVVLGGGIGTGGGDLLLDRVGRELAAISPFSPRLAVSRLGVDAVVAGASATGLVLAFDRVFGSDSAGTRLARDLFRARPRRHLRQPFSTARTVAGEVLG